LEENVQDANDLGDFEQDHVGQGDGGVEMSSRDVSEGSVEGGIDKGLSQNDLGVGELSGGVPSVGQLCISGNDDECDSERSDELGEESHPSEVFFLADGVLWRFRSTSELSMGS